MATSILPLYVASNPAMAAAEIIGDEEIPTIDLSLLRSKETSADERAKLIQRLGEACEDWGCFMVVNHGVPEDLQRKMIEAYSDFFDMKDEEKQRYNAKLFDPIRYNQNFNQTGTEVVGWREALTTTVHPTFHSPDQPQNIRFAGEEFARQTREITEQLLGAICESLGLEEKRMKSSLSLESCYQMMLASLYPPCPQPELALGVPPHTDSALLTLVMQSRSFHGLQVLHCGKWVPVELLPNSFCVFVSDLLQIFSNGKFKSRVHRCMVDKKSSRLSVASLVGPPLEGVVVSPAHELVEVAEAKHDAYRGITYKDYIQIYRDNKCWF